MNIKTESDFNVFDLFVHDKGVNCPIDHSVIARAIEQALCDTTMDYDWRVVPDDSLDRFTVRHQDGREWLERMYTPQAVRENLPEEVVAVLDMVNTSKWKVDDAGKLVRTGPARVMDLAGASPALVGALKDKTREVEALKAKGRRQQAKKTRKRAR